MASQDILFLDFDGVIADSLEESLLVSWFGMGRSRWSPTDDIPTLSAAVPDAYREVFRAVRSFARTLEEFAVPALPGLEPPRSQKEFDRIFDNLPASDIVRFVHAAQEFRDFMRAEHRDQWGELHTVFPEVEELIERFPGKVFVITAKDDLSARVVLEQAGFDERISEIRGGVKDKSAVILDIVNREGIETDQALFIDDNLKNVLQATRAGIPAAWASWGWQDSPEHLGDAVAAHVRVLRLAEVSALAADRVAS